MICYFYPLFPSQNQGELFLYLFKHIFSLQRWFWNSQNKNHIVSKFLHWQYTGRHITKAKQPLIHEHLSMMSMFWLLLSHWRFGAVVLQWRLWNLHWSHDTVWRCSKRLIGISGIVVGNRRNSWSVHLPWLLLVWWTSNDKLRRFFNWIGFWLDVVSCLQGEDCLALYWRITVSGALQLSF